jgi:hypothetical protein
MLHAGTFRHLGGLIRASIVDDQALYVVKAFNHTW